MALPPKGDPRRPLSLACIWLHVFGGLLLLMSSCTGVSMLRLGRITGPTTWIYLLMVAFFAFYALPGIAYFILPIYMMRRRRWAVTTAIALVSLQEATFVFALAANLWRVLQSPQRNFSVTFIPFAVMFLVIIALGMLIAGLTRCYEAIRHMPADERGFEPILATPVIALPSSASPSPSVGGVDHDPHSGTA